MRTTAFVYPALACVLAAGLAAAAPMPPSPLVLYSSAPAHTEPVWVAADVAVSPDGVLDCALFAPDVAFVLENLIYETPPSSSGCLDVGAYEIDEVNPPDRSTLEKAARESVLAFSAEVTEISYGFHFSQPGQLLQLRVEEFFGREGSRDLYYTFIPVGDFNAGPYRLCKTDDRYAASPDVGDEVVVMVPRLYEGEDLFLPLFYPSSLVVIKSDGRVLGPNDLVLPEGRELIRVIRREREGGTTTLGGPRYLRKSGE